MVFVTIDDKINLFSWWALLDIIYDRNDKEGDLPNFVRARQKPRPLVISLTSLKQDRKWQQYSYTFIDEMP